MNRGRTHACYRRNIDDCTISPLNHSCRKRTSRDKCAAKIDIEFTVPIGKRDLFSGVHLPENASSVDQTVYRAKFTVDSLGDIRDCSRVRYVDGFWPNAYTLVRGR